MPTEDNANLAAGMKMLTVRDLFDFLSMAPMDAVVCFPAQRDDTFDERLVRVAEGAEQLSGQEVRPREAPVPRNRPHYRIGPGDTIVVLR